MKAVLKGISALLLGAAILPQSALADANADGQTFAKSIAPTSSSQVVNPTGVNTSVWSDSTGIPTSTPSGLGGFSKPTSDSGVLSNAKALGLATFGNKTMDDCANYVVGSGDSYKDQHCAAVNFLSSRCISANQTESKILGKAGISNSSSTNCNGTFGQGQQQFNFANEITPSDSIFGTFKSVAANPTNQTDDTCSPQTVVTAPAQYKNNICTKSSIANTITCSQYLNTSITKTVTSTTTTETCPSGSTLTETGCVAASVSPGTPVYTCPNGTYTRWDKCELTTVVAQGSAYCPAHVPSAYFVNGANWGPFYKIDGGRCWFLTRPINETGSFSAAGQAAACRFEFSSNGFASVVSCNQSYSCPAGTTAQGSNCVATTTFDATVSGYSCPTGSTVSGATCITTTTSAPIITEICTDGSTPQNKTCTKTTVQSSWADTCAAYENAAGSSLGAPE